MFYCKRCLHGFVKSDSLRDHSEWCKQGESQIVVMPEPGVIEFKAYHKKERKNFVIYFDFESLVVPCDIVQGSSTRKYQQHVPCSYSIVTNLSSQIIKTMSFAIPTKILILLHHASSKT